MKILGISSYYHDSAAALTENGSIINFKGKTKLILK